MGFRDWFPPVWGLGCRDKFSPRPCEYVETGLTVGFLSWLEWFCGEPLDKYVSSRSRREEAQNWKVEIQDRGNLIWGFPKIRCPCLGLRIVRTIALLGCISNRVPLFCEITIQTPKCHP